MSFQELVDTAKDLPLDLKLELLDALNRSIQLPMDQEIEKAWDEEIDRRLDDLDSGKTVALPYEILIQRLRTKVEGWK